MTPLSIDTVSLPTQQHYQEVFPLVYAAAPGSATVETAVAWLADNRTRLLQDLVRHGAVLLRNLGLKDAQDFDAAIRAFNLTNFAYGESLSNAVRRNRTERVFTANEAPSSVSIYLHHEMAQTPIFPSRLFFFCEKPADSGGATPLCRSDILLRALERQVPHFIEACEQRGVRYSNVMPEQEDLESGQGRSWRSTLRAETVAQAEARLAQLGYEWQWREDHSLRVTSPVLPAIRTLSDGRRVFFNQLIAAFRGWQDRRNQADKSISFGDGSAVDTTDMATVIALGDELSFDIPWQQSDLALVDNFLVMHGRRPYQGTRTVLASLVA